MQNNNKNNFSLNNSKNLPLTQITNKQILSSLTVFIDFDGTICYNDVTDLLLNQFALQGYDDLEQLWLSGAISAHECMKKQIALLRATPQQLNAALDKVEIDVAFKPFLTMVHHQGAKAQVVSDGLDYSINRILSHAGITDLPVYSNHLVYKNDNKWQLEFPLKANNCPSGHCKCRRYDHLPLGKTIYIGDGTSDFCPAQKASFVLAKGKLADYCEKHGIAHQRIENFTQIIALWPDLLTQLQYIDTQNDKRIAS